MFSSNGLSVMALLSLLALVAVVVLQVMEINYYGAPQCTSTVYLPESDCLITVYGTAQNADHRTPARHVAPFQTGMIKWKPLPKESYSGVKTPPPAPIPADEALRREARRQLVWLAAIDGNTADLDMLRAATAARILTLQDLVAKKEGK